MAMQEWELREYEQAARAVCSRIHEHPDEPMFDSATGATAPRWVAYAVRMHELRLMQAAMRDYGPFGAL